MTEASLIGLLEATVSFGALLYLAALGEMLIPVVMLVVPEQGGQ